MFSLRLDTRVLADTHRVNGVPMVGCMLTCIHLYFDFSLLPEVVEPFGVAMVSVEEFCSQKYPIQYSRSRPTSIK